MFIDFLKMKSLILLALILLASCKTTQVYKKSEAIPPENVSARVDAVYDIAVVGAGAAGSMAAFKGAFQNDSVILFTGGKKGNKRARGPWVPEIESLPTLKGIKRPIVAMRNDIIRQVHESPFRDNLAVVDEEVLKIKKVKEHSFDIFAIEGENHQVYKAKTVILATGMMDTQPDIKGSIKPILKVANSQQAIYCIRCDGHLAYQKEVSVIGSSKDAAENALLLYERFQPPKISIVTNGKTPTWNKKTTAALKLYGIAVHTQNIEKFITTDDSRLSGIHLDGGASVPAQLLVVSLGVRVNNALAKDLGVKLDARGFVITTKDGLTNVAGVYAIGDLQAGLRKQVYLGWDSAFRAAEHIDSIVRKQKFKDGNLRYPTP